LLAVGPVPLHADELGARHRTAEVQRGPPRAGGAALGERRGGDLGHRRSRPGDGRRRRPFTQRAAAPTEAQADTEGAPWMSVTRKWTELCWWTGTTTRHRRRAASSIPRKRSKRAKCSRASSPAWG